MNEGGNRFFRLPNRANSGSSISAILNVECLQQGLTYMTSAKTRIHAEFDHSYYFYFRYLIPGTENSWYSYTYLECQPRRYSNRWVTCCGKFIVTDVISNSEEHNFVSNTLAIKYSDRIPLEEVSVWFPKAASFLSCHLSHIIYYFPPSPFRTTALPHFEIVLGLMITPSAKLLQFGIVALNLAMAIKRTMRWVITKVLLFTA